MTNHNDNNNNQKTESYDTIVDNGTFNQDMEDVQHIANSSLKSPSQRGGDSISGSTPDVESDDDVLQNAHEVGIAPDADFENPTELNIAQNIDDAEMFRRTYSNVLSNTNAAMKSFDVQSYVTSLDTVLSADADDSLGSVLPLVNSSHSPLFIFRNQSEFLGLVSPYQALYAHRYPYTTKLASIATMPPYLTEHTQLYDVASYMLESRVYVLPLFDDSKQILGVIDSKDVLKNLFIDQELLIRISSSIEIHTPITALKNATVGAIFQKMKEMEVSRIVLIDQDGVLAGIVSRKDLHVAFMKPTDKQRFGKDGTQQTDRAFDNEKKFRSDEVIQKYATKIVYTLPYETKHEEILKQLIASEHNSVVLIDKHDKPVGFLSMHDILVALASLRPQKSIHIVFTKPTSNVSEENMQEAKQLLTKFSQKIGKRIALDAIEITFEEPKTPSGGSIVFNTSLVVRPKSGAKLVSKTRSRSFLDSIHSAISQIEKQQRRSGLSKADTH